MRSVALSLVLAVVVSTNPWRWPCECDAMAAPAGEEMAADHGCCAGDKSPAPVRIEGTCAPGCCDGDEPALTSLVEAQPRLLAERHSTPTPAWLLPHVLERVPGAVLTRLTTPPRAPPPTAARLSLLQVLIC